ncbi:MAG: glycosyltransferase family 2 protein [Candidatus Micrarchaeota archaeon]|nr:glycosyltransferase family 2 protein [Candidatus Micrarchaeota archaeon]
MDLSPTRIIEYIMMFLVLFFTTTMLLIYLKNRQKVREIPKTTRFEPTVSFVIPAYNEENTILETIKSVLNSDYPKNKLEVIVVNDGSKDKTAEVVKSIKDKRVRLINKQNSGKADSLNRGIKEAKGEIIVTLDADSYIEKDSLRKMLAYFKEDVAAVTSAVKVRERENMTFLEKLQRLEYLFTIFNRRLFAMINGVYVTPGPFSAFRREIFDEVGGFDPNNIMEDQEIALRIQAANYKIESCMDAVVYTDVPKDFSSFMRQRERWHRGGFRNILKYRYTVNPKYGDFGMFVMLYSILSIVLLVVVSMAVATAVSKGNFLVLDKFLLTVEPIHILSVIVLAITLFWTVLALKEMKESRIRKRYLLIYTLLYCYLITLFMFIAIFKELKGEKQRW